METEEVLKSARSIKVESNQVDEMKKTIENQKLALLKKDTEIAQLHNENAK